MKQEPNAGGSDTFSLSSVDGEPILREYADFFPVAWESASIPERITRAAEKHGGDFRKGLVDFMDDELNYLCVGYTTAIIYMPNYISGRGAPAMKGKIILEVCQYPQKKNESLALYFEFQLCGKTDFSLARREILRDNPWTGLYRYHNIRIAGEDAPGLVQSLLFSDLFRQRFLMTTESRVLGSMTTHSLRSPLGNVHSFRQCALNE